MSLSATPGETGLGLKHTPCRASETAIAYRPKRMVRIESVLIGISRNVLAMKAWTPEIYRDRRVKQPMIGSQVIENEANKNRHRL